MVVAEGIETVDELQAVIAAGAHFGQGYLLARPAFPLPEVTWPNIGGEDESPTGPVSTRKKVPTLRPRTTTKNPKKR
jgi:EAL domain-containing protein (putative c-di-GMP-specific phosphodiesterase class I)